MIKPTMTHGAECWTVGENDENILHVADMRILRWIRGKTRKDHVRNQIIQEDAKVCQMSTFLRQLSGEEKKTASQEKWWTWSSRGREEGGRPIRTYEQIRTGRYEKIWTDSWHDWQQTVLENDNEDWPTKMWRWSLKVRGQKVWTQVLRPLAVYSKGFPHRIRGGSRPKCYPTGWICPAAHDND